MHRFVVILLAAAAAASCLARGGDAAPAAAPGGLDAKKWLPLSDSGHVRVRWSVANAQITFDLEVDAAPGESAHGGRHGCGTRGMRVAGQGAIYYGSARSA